MAEIEIDLTDGVMFSRGASLPGPAILEDDGDIVLMIGNIRIRMNYEQADVIFGAYQKWVESVPAESTLNLNEFAEQRDKATP